MTSRVCRALSAFALFVGAMSLLPGSASAVAAHSDPQPVQVGIGQVSPQIPDFTDVTKTMTFSGQLRNTGPTALKNIHLVLQRTQVTARSDLGTADGIRYEIDSSKMKITALAAGAGQAWTITQTERELFGFNKPDPGVYAIDVDAFDSDGVFLGGQRTYVVWKPTKQDDAKVARLALLWPVVGQPALTGQKMPNADVPVIADPAAAQQFAQDGRLTQILDKSQGLTVNYLLDPDLLYNAQQLSTSYFYQDKDKKQIGAPGTAPATWYAKASALFADQQNCWNLLYGDPDVNTLARSQAGKALLNAATDVRKPAVTADICQRNGPTAIAWPSDGQADAGTLAALAGTKAPNLVTLVGSNQVSAWPSAHASLPNSPNTVVYDNYLSSVFHSTAKPPPSSLNNQGVLDGQIWLAQTALADRDNTDRVLVVAPPRDFNPAPELLSAIKAMSKLPPADQWFQLDPLSKVLSTPAAAQHPSALTAVKTANLPDPVVNSSFDSQQLYSSLHAIMPGRGDYDSDVSFRPVATWWRDHGEDSAYSQSVYGTAVRDHGLVAFGDQTPPLTMSGKSGTVPVTIKNETNATIRIFLRAQNQGPFTMELKVNADQGPHTIDRGQVATIRIPVVARGNGQQVTLTAKLYTCPDLSKDCTYDPSNLITPLKTNGGQTMVTVKVSRIGIIALALIIGSGMLLILLIGLRVYRAKRAHHAPVQDTMAS